MSKVNPPLAHNKSRRAKGRNEISSTLHMRLAFQLTISKRFIYNKLNRPQYKNGVSQLVGQSVP